MKYFIYLIFCLTLLSCDSNQDIDELKKDFLLSDSTDQMLRYADLAESLGVEGIPVLLEVLEKSLQNQDKVENYGRINICLNSLHDLASAGVFTINEVPILINAIRTQRLITDTLTTADILKTITGIDVGYDEEFVNNYSNDDESLRQKMINKWEIWYNQKILTNKTSSWIASGISMPLVSLKLTNQWSNRSEESPLFG